MKRVVRVWVSGSRVSAQQSSRAQATLPVLDHRLLGIRPRLSISATNNLHFPSVRISMSVDPQKVSENTGVHRKSKTKKTKAEAVITESGNGTEGDPHSEVMVEKKRKKRKRDLEASEGDRVDVDIDQKKNKKKKQVASESHTQLVEHREVGPSVEGSKDIRKREKKKHAKTKDTDVDEVEIHNHQTDQITKKKKKKKGESLPNPEEDESLDDQARKGELPPICVCIHGRHGLTTPNDV